MLQTIMGGVANNTHQTNTEFNLVSGNGLIWSGTEHFQIISAPGTLSDMRVKVNVASGAGNSYLWKLRLNGADTGLTVTISGASAKTGQDLVNSVAVVAGDRVSISLAPTSTPSLSTRTTWTFLFTSTNNNESLLMSMTGLGVATDATTYMGVQGWSSTPSSTSQMSQMVVAAPGTIDEMYIFLDVDPGDSPEGYTFTLQKNGSDTTVVVAIVADSVSGNDTAHSFSVVAGDRLSIKIVGVSTPTTTPTIAAGILFAPTIDGESLIMGGTDDNLSVSATEYNAIAGGRGLAWNATEQIRSNMGQQIVVSAFYVHQFTAPSTGDSYTYTLRQNTADTDLEVVIANTDTTGNDTTNSIQIEDDDDMSVRVVPFSNPDGSDTIWGMKMVVGVLPVAAVAPGSGMFGAALGAGIL